MMFMKKKLEVFHIEKPPAMGLQLYYKNRDLSMFIILPEDICGLNQVDTNLLDMVLSCPRSQVYCSLDKENMCFRMLFGRRKTNNIPRAQNSFLSEENLRVTLGLILMSFRKGE